LGGAEEALKRLVRSDPVLSNPTRLAIMLMLAMRRKIYFSELQKALGLTPGNLGSHLKRLEEAGYVRIRKVLTRIRPLTLIVLKQEGEVALYSYLKDLKEALGELL